MGTASPMSRSTAAYQATPTELNDGSFFEEAIDTSPTPIEMGFGSSYIPSPQTAEYPMFGENGAFRNVAAAAENDNPMHWTDTRRQSQASSAMSESSISGGIAAKPRKRGRKPKKQLKDQDSFGPQGEVDDDDLPKDPRRRRILERNRIAATKCRLRKRDEASALASREQAMEDQNRYLSTCFDSLTAEIYHLKTQLLQHTDCNCILIQKYIANEAKKSVDGLIACSSSFYPCGGSMIPEYMSSHGASGSSSASSADSLNLHSPDSDSIPSTWSSYFQQGPPSEVREDAYDMGLEPFQKYGMLPESMTSAPPVPAMPLAGYDQGLYINAGPQEHRVDGLWDSHWKYR